MDISLASPLLGGLSPHQFMRRHWQKKPLLVRQALPGGTRLIERAQLFDLASHDEVESRLIVRRGAQWTLRQGPFKRAALPLLKQREWTLLVQSLDLHIPAARALLDRFRFVPDARLDDLMASWASPGGGVGPHVDSYDVFLLQVQGCRRWRVAPPGDAGFIAGLPLKILSRFEPVHDWLLEPGDMLYLPPGWGHDGVAEGGDCITCSVGFLAPAIDTLGHELLQRLADDDGEPGALYRDPRQAATATPAAIPDALLDFAQAALQRRLAEPHWLPRALGEALTEPKPQVWFKEGAALTPGAGIKLDARTRMMYDARHVFINGEAFRAGGRDARLMQRLADDRRLSAAEVRRLGPDAAGLLADWAEAGWLSTEEP